MTEVVGGNVDAGNVVEDWPDTVVVDPTIVELGEAVPEAVVIAEAMNRI